MSAHKLKSFKVADLRAILSKASVSAPARATKSDLVARILASDQALQAFHSLYPPPDSPPRSVSNNVPATTTQQQSPSAATESPVVTPPPPVIPHPPHSAPPAESTATNTVSDVEKYKQRAERFGVHVTSPSDSRPVDPELEKRKKRAERFGIPLVGSSKSKQSDGEDKIEARGARFGTAGQKRAASREVVDADELERRRRRAERFGLVM